MIATGLTSYSDTFNGGRQKVEWDYKESKHSSLETKDELEITWQTYLGGTKGWECHTCVTIIVQCYVLARF